MPALRCGVGLEGTGRVFLQWYGVVGPRGEYGVDDAPALLGFVTPDGQGGIPVKHFQE